MAFDVNFNNFLVHELIFSRSGLVIFNSFSLPESCGFKSSSPIFRSQIDRRTCPFVFGSIRPWSFFLFFGLI
jgi:hypothetical protein